MRELLHAAAEVWRLLGETALLMVGLPDYARYVSHRRSRHPGLPVMSRPEFVKERMARRYAGNCVGRCC